MTDIVERLQTLAEHHKEALREMNVPLTEAAAEIERLRSALMTIARREAPGSADYDWAEVDYARKVLGWEIGDD